MKRIQAVIAIPPIRDFYFTPHRFAGLGVEILSRILKSRNIKVTIFNFPIMKKKAKKLPLPRILDYLKDYIIKDEIGKLSFFTHYQRFGPPLDECVNLIKHTNPDLIFISCFAYCYAQITIELANRLKHELASIPIVAGGGGVSVYPSYFIKNKSIDYCIEGEAEVSLPVLLDILLNSKANYSFSHVPNLHYKDGEEINFSGKKLYTKAGQLHLQFIKTREKKHYIQLSTALSRGCLRQCQFCTNYLSHGRNFRIVPFNKVEESVLKLKKRLNNNNKQVCLNFEDDNILLASEYFLDVLEFIKIHIPNVSFSAENGLDYTLLTPQLTRNLIRKGFIKFNLSLACLNNMILKREKRNSDLQGYEKILEVLSDHYIKVITYFICGLKGDTKKSTAHTLAYLAKLQTLIGISPFYAVPGLPGFKDLQQFKKYPPLLCAGLSCYPWYNSLSSKSIITAFRICRFINLLKNNKTDLERELLQQIINEKRLYTVIKTIHGKEKIPVPNMDEDLVNLFFAEYTFNK